MHSLLARIIRPGVAVLFCAVVAGCAMEMAPYGQTQSLESSVQVALSKQGYYQGPIDGSIGPATSRAIRNYQRDHKLTPTGTINTALVVSMGLAGQANYISAPYYTGYPAYYAPTYVSPAWYAPAVFGIGWGGGWGGGYGGYWNRGWGGCGGYGRGYGGYWNRGYGGYNGHGWCR